MAVCCNVCRGGIEESGPGGEVATRNPQVALRWAAGFTLIELLTVIIIIAILSGIGLTVAVSLQRGSKVRQTEDILRSLDGIISEVMTARQGNPSAFYATEAGDQYPLVDGASDGLGTDPATNLSRIQPSLPLFLESVVRLPGIEAKLASLPPQYASRRDVVAIGWSSANAASRVQTLTRLLNVNDAWGNPIRFVHPRFEGGAGAYVNMTGTRLAMSVRPLAVAGAPNFAAVEFTRSWRPTGTVRGTADEGITTGGRPYVYSSGPDGNPGTRDDNVYLTRPAFPAETRDAAP